MFQSTNINKNTKNREKVRERVHRAHNKKQQIKKYSKET